MAIRILYDPGSFFEGRTDGPDHYVPFGILFLVLVLRKLPELAQAMKVAPAYSNPQYGSEGMFGLSYWQTELLGVLNSWFLWIVMFLFYVGVFHLVLVILTGDASFPEIVSIIGWGYLPKAIGGILSLVITITILQSIPTPQTITETGEFSRQFVAHPFFELLVWIPWLFTIWAGFIWTVGLNKFYDLTYRYGVPLTAVTIIVSYFVYQNILLPYSPWRILVRLYYGF